MNFQKEAPRYYKNLQDEICQAISDLDEKNFHQDEWQREGGGGGKTRIFEGGVFLEKGGVNFSEVYGEFSEDFAKTLPYGDGTQFYASGISLVLHPINPIVPTVHANYRMIQRGSSAWFGGGADLTPFYPEIEDVQHFHKTYKEALDSFGTDLYPQFKKECDEYFYLPHRKETRGIGGIFFDYQMATEEKFAMQKACGNAFVQSYFPIAKKHYQKKFTEKQKNFQEYRRGRYVEFNLLYDRGTIFGLKTNGRVESILMSLPKHAQWHYNWTPEPGSDEAKLYEFLKPRDWLS